MQPGFWKTLAVFAGLGSSLCFLAVPAEAQEVVPDGTLGAEASRVIRDAPLRRRPDRPGVRADIIEGGARRGGNLFHSFRQFDVPAGSNVYFDSPDGVGNILGRVTSADISDIFGTLGVDGTANLFLLNPNGILFGPNARLDVNGSFVGSTANAVQFGTQGFFSTTDTAAPPLLTVNPSAFLFNQINPTANITNQSVAPLGANNRNGTAVGLGVPFDRSLILLGGNVILENGSGLNAFGGRIELGGLSNPGTVNLLGGGNQLRLGFPAGVARSDVAIRGGSTVDVVANGGGDVAVTARNVELSGASNIFTGIGFRLNSRGVRAGDVEIDATGILSLSDSSFIESSVFAQGIGDSGDVRVNSGSVSIRSSSGLGSAVLGEGDSGDVTVRAADTILISDFIFLDPPENTVFRGSGILSLIGTTDDLIGQGDGGDIDLQARQIILADGAQVATDNRGGIGNAGDIRISNTDALLMSGDRTVIQSGTSGVGNGGNTSIQVRDTVSMSSGARILSETTGSGNAGDVTVTAGNAVLMDGTSTDFDGDGDRDRSGINSSVQVGGGTESREAGLITVNTGTLRISNEAGLLSNIEAGAVGVGRGIQINANSMQMLNGAQVQSLLRGSEVDGNGNTLAAAQGNAGDIRINLTGDFIANPFINNDPNQLGLRSEIFTSVGEGAIGDAGNVFLQGRNITLQNGSQIVSDTSGSGNSGQITLQSSGQVLFEGTFPNPGGSPFLTGIFSSINSDPNATTGNSRVAGNVDITAGSLVLRQGGYIFANVESGAVGQGGTINLSGGSILLQGGSQIQSILRGEQRDAQGNLTTAGARGRTGDVNVTLVGDFVADGLDADNLSSGILTSVETGTVGDAGNIIVQARSVRLTNGGRLITSTNGTGNAGGVGVRGIEGILFNGDTNPSDTFVPDKRSGINSSVEDANPDTNGNRILGRRAGDILVIGGNFTMTNGAGIFANVEGEADGQGGNIVITVENMAMRNGSIIQSLLRQDSLEDEDTQGATGRTGNIGIVATGTFTARGLDPNSLSSNEISTSAGRGTSGDAGDIFLQSRSVRFRDGSALETGTSGQGTAGSVGIQAGGVVVFDGDTERSDSGITSSVNAAAGASFRRAGNIEINAGRLIIRNDAVLFANVEAGAVGRAGDILINADSMRLVNGGQVQAILRGANPDRNLSGARGRTGVVLINLEDGIFTATGQGEFASGVFTLTEQETVGNAGRIGIIADSIRLDNGAIITSSTESVGDSGRIILVSSEDTIIRDNSDIRTEATATASGEAGEIGIITSELTLLGTGSDISATTESSRGGNIAIDAEQITVQDTGVEDNGILASSTSGRGGNVTILEGLDTLTIDNGRIAASTDTGIAGSVEIEGADQVLLTNSGRLSVAALVNRGGAGDLTVNANVIRVDNAQIFASTQSRRPGRANRFGNITLEGLEFLEVTNEGLVSAATVLGRAGTLTVDAEGGAVELRNGGELTVIASGENGRAGSLDVVTDRLLVQGGDSQASVSSLRGESGNLTIDAEAIRLNNGDLRASTVETSRDEKAEIRMEGVEQLYMQNNSQINAEAGERARGGNVILNNAEGFAVGVLNQDSNIQASAQEGRGGEIEIDTLGIYGFRIRPDQPITNDIDASSAAGPQGIVTINQFDPDPSRGLLQLPTGLTDASQQINRACRPRSEAEQSEFVVTGRGGLPPSPTQPLDGTETSAEWVTETGGQGTELQTTATAAAATENQATQPIVEAQGWIVGENGKVMLVAEAPTAPTAVISPIPCP